MDTEAYLEISYTGDVLQVYADGELVDDEFYRGVPFLTRDFLGEKKKIQVWISRLKPGSCYLEQGQREGLCLEQVRWIPIYKKSWNFTQRTAKPNL